MSDVLRILAVLALVGANAFFVIGEYAVVTARRAGLLSRAEAGHSGARAALALMDDPVRVISTVQVGITALGILTGALSEPLIRGILGDSLPHWATFSIAFAIVTYLSVVFGELVPKALTLDRAETLAALVSRPVTVFATALHPVVWLLQGSAALVLKPFGIAKVTAGDSVSTPGELRALVDEAEGSGVIPLAQEELLHNVLDFAGQEVSDVMLAAHDVAWLEASLTPEEALDAVLEQPHARYPVSRGDLNHLVGIVHVHELLAAARRQTAQTIEELARPALVVPANKDLGALLREQRESSQHLSVVIDEYGGVVGVVSLEDVLEELVGEISDEFDLPDSRLDWRGDHVVGAAGSMTIDDFNETVGTAFPQGSAKTLAGLVFHALGRRPALDDTVTVGEIGLRVEALDGLRIAQLEITMPAVGEEA